MSPRARRCGASPRPRSTAPGLLLSVYVRFDGDAFWARLEEAARHPAVALIHYQAGARKSYRLTPKVDAFLKQKLLRARVQLVCAGGDTRHAGIGGHRV